MVNLSMNDKLILLQHAINKYDSENILKEKLKNILSPKDIERVIDTLIGTQKVRRIGQTFCKITSAIQENYQTCLKI